MHRVIGDVGAHRLLSFDSDQLTGGPTVEFFGNSSDSGWPANPTACSSTRQRSASSLISTSAYSTGMNRRRTLRR